MKHHTTTEFRLFFKIAGIVILIAAVAQLLGIVDFKM